MRLIFGTILVLCGIVGTMVISRLLLRPSREAGVEGSLKALRFVAMAVVPIGALRSTTRRWPRP
jgi:hypothetical protein